MLDSLNNRYVKFFICLVIITSLLFFLFPKADLYITKIFYKQNNRFFLAHHNIVQFFFNIVPYIVKTLAITYISIFIIININKKKLALLNNKTIIYLTLTLILGPGLTINTIFKDLVFGRARPKHITEFGGNKSFTTPFTVAKECVRNCSFVSGHAAIGFYFTALTFLIRNKSIATLIFYGSVIFGFTIGTARILQGGHFFSDVIYSGFIVISINYLLYILFFKQR
ncbi:MAG: phosphatase PAP2 family protein [Rickettsiales endosymbiont of Dermacentor nuttalli]